MSEDIRLSLDFLTNRKRKKLQKILGAEGVLSLIDLWLSAARQRPAGELLGYASDDIEIDANWEGERGLFVSTLIEIGFLEHKDGVYSLHNWDKRQAWVVKSEERSDKARFSKLAQTNKSIFNELKGKGIESLSKKDYAKLAKRQRIANDMPANASDPLAPAPAPTHNVYKEKNTKKENLHLLEHLNQKINAEGLGSFQNSLVKFCKYRKEIGDAYKTTYGINGLIKDAQECLKAGLDLESCIEEAMGKEWKAIKPDYFKNKINGKKPESKAEPDNYIDPIHYLSYEESEAILQAKFKAAME